MTNQTNQVSFARIINEDSSQIFQMQTHLNNFTTDIQTLQTENHNASVFHYDHNVMGSGLIKNTEESNMDLTG